MYLISKIKSTFKRKKVKSSFLQMASGVPLTARTLAHAQHNDMQRVANPRFEVNERRLRPIYDFMEMHK